MKRPPYAPLVFAASLLFGSSLVAETAAPAAPAPHADAYVVKAVAKRDVVLNYPARLKSIRSATVVSRVTGVLLEKRFKEGDYVKKGTRLYKIEPDLYQAAVNEQKASVILQESLYTKAERDWKRAQALYKDNAISVQEHDAALSAYETARAQVNASKAQLQTRELELGYTDVTAPISGIAGIKQTDVGNVVNAGTPLVTITQTDPIYALFSIPSGDLQKARVENKEGRWSWGNEGRLKASLDVDGIKVSGDIDFIAPTADTQTGSISVRARFKNSDNLLLPGTFGRVTLEGISRDNVIMIPQKAVLQNPMGTIVFVEQEGQAAVRPVVLGDPVGNSFVVRKGLAEGDKVIVNNFFRVKPGAPVIIDKTVDAEGK
ncbi:efflux RND transporter periplasmic adaptor subunit [Sulfurimonas sp. HSL-3221]|uniref:efflux RND transporter periplasmic adaptor subunit n=1 Tax=Sulfurimonadaceae TaxID=2771471 RepID=UPI001E46F07B|nr:efflux RND transporter periplasmic adaptor subunit [Sulfurimonas sp. HSL-3221]UFS61618.1 efflux RND transporter periplasmic adaptor subunit [Sulfurimonas sp. HSL-3221]